MVGIRGTGDRAGFSGLQSCGSVWSCPICSAKIMARRSLELGAALLTWENDGGQLVAGTLTMRHRRGHSLTMEWDALRDAWASVRQSRVWRKWLQRLGSPGLVLVVEVTYGANGWHVHMHFVLLARGIDAALLAEFTGWLLAKWDRAIRAAGMPGALQQAQDVHLVDGITAAVDLGEYLAKSTAYGAAESMGREMFGSWSKTARGAWSTEPVWRIAESFGEYGDMELLDLWHEYERGSKGRRQCTWSRGLREQLDIGAELTDEEIAAESIDDHDHTVLDATGWAAVLDRIGSPRHLLVALREQGVPGVRALLDTYGIRYAMEVS